MSKPADPKAPPKPEEKKGPPPPAKKYQDENDFKKAAKLHLKEIESKLAPAAGKDAPKAPAKDAPAKDANAKENAADA